MASSAKTEKLELNPALRSGVAILAGDRAACGDKRTCADIKSKVPNPSPSIGEGHTDWIMGELKPISARNRNFESSSLQRRDAMGRAARMAISSLTSIDGVPYAPAERLEQVPRRLGPR